MAKDVPFYQASACPVQDRFVAATRRTAPPAPLLFHAAPHTRVWTYLGASAAVAAGATALLRAGLGQIDSPVALHEPGRRWPRSTRSSGPSRPTAWSTRWRACARWTPCRTRPARTSSRRASWRRSGPRCACGLWPTWRPCRRGGARGPPSSCRCGTADASPFRPVAPRRRSAPTRRSPRTRRTSHAPWQRMTCTCWPSSTRCTTRRCRAPSRRPTRWPTSYRSGRASTGRSPRRRAPRSASCWRGRATG